MITVTQLEQAVATTSKVLADLQKEHFTREQVLRKRKFKLENEVLLYKCSGLSAEQLDWCIELCDNWSLIQIGRELERKI